jgi:hypothetical protein
VKDLHWLCSISLCALSFGCTSQAIDSPDEGPASQASQVESLTPQVVYTPKAKVELSAAALAFNPTIEGELWVALRQFPSGLPCTQTVDTGCAALPGVMAVVSDATSATPSAELKEDGNSWHFMRRPAAMAWSEGLLFATCGEALTDNYEDDDIPYAGPVLWSSDPAIFGVEPLPEQNGTHLDMLHETPYCMGIAHEADNAYWAFNGLAGSLDRVDFHAPHQIGGENHSDGEVHRYIAGQLLRVPEVPSHLVYDKMRSLVYVVDTGHARVLSVDPSTATPGDEIKKYELLAASGAMEGAEVSTLIAAGKLERPSGIALADDVLYVTDNATSRIHTFDITGKALRIFDTGLPAGSLAGITLGPDGSLYLSDLLSGSAYRIDVPAAP